MESSQSLVIAALERSGSHMLCSALRETGLAGESHEYFNPDRMTHPAKLAHVIDLRVNPYWSRPILRATRALGHPHFLSNRVEQTRLIRGRSLNPYLQRIRRSTSTPNGVFSMSVQWSQWELATRLGAIEPSDLGPRTTWIRLVRDDTLAQAISFCRAMQSGAWMAKLEREDRLAPVYDADAIAESFESLTEADIGWGQYFAAWDIEPIEITYEELSRDPGSIVARILLALDVDTIVEAQPTTVRQGGSESAEWAERFLTERPEFAERRYRSERA